MSTHSTATHHHGSEAKLYVKVLLALLVLTVITVLAAGVHWGSNTVNVVVALTIASVKASLVALYFMHLRHDKPVNAIIFVSALMFLGLLLGLTMIDTESRDKVIPANLRVPTAVGAPGAAGTAAPGAAGTVAPGAAGTVAPGAAAVPGAPAAAGSQPAPAGSTPSAH